MQGSWRGVAAAACAGFAWGVAASSPTAGLPAVFGAFALAGALRAPGSGAAVAGVFAVAWSATALVWFPAAWTALGGPLGPAAAGALVAAQALPVFAAIFGAHRALARGVPAWVALPLALAALDGCAEWLQPLPIGAALGLAGAPALLWPAALLGRPALGALLGALPTAPPRVAAGLAAGWLLVGAWWVSADLPADLPVGVIQPNVGPLEGRTASTAEARAERLRALARLDEAALVVAPEGAWPLPAAAGGTRGAALASAFRGFPPVAVGADVFDGDARYNAVVGVEDGAITGIVAKRLLVPGSERRWLGLGRDRYLPGPASPRVLPLAGVSLGPLLCYEVLFGRSLRAADAAGAELLVAATNDGWSGPIGAREHLGAARLAAVETGRWVVRPALSGISAVIDPRGRLVWSLPWVDADAAESGGEAGVVFVAAAAPRWCGARATPWLGGLAALALAALATTGAWRSSRPR